MDKFSLNTKTEVRSFALHLAVQHAAGTPDKIIDRAEKYAGFLIGGCDMPEFVNFQDSLNKLSDIFRAGLILENDLPVPESPRMS